MKHNLFINRTILFAFLLVFPLILPIGSQAAERGEGSRALQDEGLKQIAVESVQDTLKLCLSRIPADASNGQLMLAKQNCQQVEVERQRKQLSF
ncbi:hypothetical protein [Candidatus Nitronereus thalassa]|uniref:Uncharacterized protein n=1 Tax=Candidatus Nitronereus thalassa TaxID=3020898 RepID=A0ABU3K765_9BACT|nr:hypothetical protein [Candidatus Nitronereus thalassa]MDT7042200.1 hypothetical protein [Candidatus Nitronereus thalassa]